jgi:hypothetical protein
MAAATDLFGIVLSCMIKTFNLYVE